MKKTKTIKIKVKLSSLEKRRLELRQEAWEEDRTGYMINETDRIMNSKDMPFYNKIKEKANLK